MTHFAEIDASNVVTRVIVAEQEFIDSGLVGDPKNWIQTSYNTRGGIHYAPNTNTPDGGIALRKNFAFVGGTYDPARDAFIPPKPYASWVLNEQTCLWEAPVPYPADGQTYAWDEAAVNWVLIQQTEQQL